MPFTLRNLKEDMEDLGSSFDGAPDLDFRLATTALAAEFGEVRDSGDQRIVIGGLDRARGARAQQKRDCVIVASEVVAELLYLADGVVGAVAGHQRAVRIRKRGSRWR